MVDKNNTAKVSGRSLNISTKMSVEICNYIRGKSLKQAKQMIQYTVDQERAVPVRRYSWNRGHRKGVGPGKYPVKAGTEFLNLFNSLEANAENKGLNVNSLYLVHAKADKAEARWHSTRKGRTKMKNTHVELIVEERNVEDKKEGKK
ncbi:50S ribosomal protein L22 [Candidatus Woesearchaeota archaeon]|nr:50S ribosomal protein L22 [Candidatus Woesearchaeota archaeon]